MNSIAPKVVCSLRIVMQNQSIAGAGLVFRHRPFFEERNGAPAPSWTAQAGGTVAARKRILEPIKESKSQELVH